MKTINSWPSETTGTSCSVNRHQFDLKKDDVDGLIRDLGSKGQRLFALADEACPGLVINVQSYRVKGIENEDATLK